MDRPAELLGRGIVVLGMHRSGTSAVTGVMDALGLPACIASDRFPTQRWNARGNYESSSLSIFDDQLLQLMGATWWAPPALSAGWAGRREISGMRDRGRRLFAAAHPTGRWVWKDPRACLLMPFWDLVLGPDMPRIVVLRNPAESAGSLLERNGIPREHAYALTERSLARSLRDSAGRPVFITTYDDLMAGIDDWCRRAAAYASANGVPMPHPLAISAAAGFVDASLRHHREPADLAKEQGVSLGLRRLWSWAMERRGAHDALSIKGLPRESQATSALLHGILIGYRLAFTPELGAPRG
jgi:hypothetical protein